MAKKVRLRHRRAGGRVATDKTLTQHRSDQTAGRQAPGPRAKLSWVLGAIGGLFAIAAAVAGYSIWMILGRH